MNARKVLGRLAVFTLLALGLGAYIWLVERPRIADEAADDLLLDFTPDAVTGLRLAYDGAAPIVLERDDPASPWRIVEPLSTKADDTTVERLVVQISEAKAERRIGPDEAADLATYGLEGDGERARVSVRLADGTRLPDVIVGRTTPVGYLAFARVEGDDDVLVTPLIFHTGVRKTLLELRDKSLFSFPVESVVALRITAGDRVLRLERSDDGWAIVEPVRDRADPEPVRSLLAGLAALQALDFYDDGIADDAGLSPAASEIELTLSDGSHRGLRIGATAPGQPPGYYVERTPDGLIAKGPDWLPARLAPDPTPLRDRHLFTCGSADVARARVARSDAPEFALIADDDGWRMEPASDREVRQPVAARRIAALSGLRGEKMVVDPVGNGSKSAGSADYGLDRPVVEIELVDADGRSCGRLRAGRVETDGPTGTAFYLERVEDGAVFSVPEHVFSRTDLYADELLAPPPAPPGG